MKRVLAGLAVVLLAACGGKRDPLVETLAQTIEGARMLNRAVGLSTALYGAATIAVIAPHEVIAESIRGRMKSETGTCATIGGTGATATLTTPDAGCTLASAGYLIKGTLSCTVKTGPSPYLQIACGLDLVVDGLSLSGTFDVFTEMGNDYRFGADLVGARGDLDDNAIMRVLAPDVTAGVAAQTGDVTANVTAGETTFAMAGVKQGLAQCYPKAGAITVAGGELQFSSGSPQTGTASYVTPSGASTVTLAKRPGCP